MWRIRDVYPGSRTRLFSIPDPNYLHPGSSSKNLSIFLTPKKAKKWFLSSKKHDPGCSSRIPDPDADFLPSRIPDPQGWVKKAPNPGSRIRIRNTDLNITNLPTFVWILSQESFERVKEEGGSLLFVAGPSPALASSPTPSLYPGLQDNQAFLATRDLRQLAHQVSSLFLPISFYVWIWKSLRPLPSSSQLITKVFFCPNYCWGSLTFWCGPGFGSADVFLWLTDLDLRIFFNDFKDAKKNIFPYFFFL